MPRKRGAAKQGSFDGKERDFSDINDVKAAIAAPADNTEPPPKHNDAFKEALRQAAERSFSAASKTPSQPQQPKAPAKANSPKQQQNNKKQKRHHEEDIDQILDSFRGGSGEGPIAEEQFVFSKALFNSVKKAPFRILAIIILIAVLFVLKSGEDQYHSLITSTHTLEVDPYELLGVPRTATRADIRRAHRRLSLEWHPDKREQGCDEECHRTFKQINEAYKLLADDKRRSLYDQTQKVTSGSSHAFFSNLQATEYLLTRPAWDSIVAPSLSHRQLWTPPDISGVWTFLIADPRSEWTENLIPLWTELAARFYGRISFMRVDSTDPLADKLLPVKLRITPAIMTLTPGGVPNVYDKMLHFQPRHLVSWLQEGVPNVLRRWTGSAHELKTLLLDTPNAPDGRLYVVLTSGRVPSTLHKALALRTSSLFDWIYVDTPDLVETLADYIGDLPKATKGLILAPDAAGNNTLSVVQLPSSHWQLDKIDLRISEEQEDLLDSPAAVAHRELTEALVNIVRNNEIPVFEENLPFLCRSKEENVRVLCSIRVDPIAKLSKSDIRLVEDHLNTVGLPDHLEDNENAVEADEYEDDEPTDNEARTTRLVQHLRLNTSPLGALGSALTRLAQMGNVRLHLDLGSASYSTKAENQWLPLPFQCATAVGKATPQSWIARHFGSHYPCAPRWKLSHKEALQYWWAGHPLLATALPLVLGALVVAWPRRKAVPGTLADGHEHEE